MDALDLIAKIKMDLSEYEEGLDKAKKDAESGGSSIGGAFGKLAAGGIKGLGVAITAAAAGVGALTTAAVNSYADYEQLVGGVETLFGTQGMSLETYADSVGKSIDEARAEYYKLEQAQDLVLENASKAYKTAGMSANEYMEQATSTAAALVSSLGGNTQKAAEYADKAIIDMSDNANKMGTDMEAIQNAYNGFAKGNFTMLDNLKLGYGGTKEEMERLLEDAEKISGIEYDVSNYADIVDAIHVVQDEMGITGTTAKEASETISGSLASAKSAWENLITGLGDKDANVSSLIDEFTESVGTFIGNVIPIAEQALTGISKMISQLVPKIVEEVPRLINDVLPQLLESGASITQAILDGISGNIDSITSGLVEALLTLADSILSMLPQFIEVGIQVITSLINGAAEALPELIPQVVEALLGMLDSLLGNADGLMDAGLNLIEGLFNGIMTALPIVLEALPEIVQKIADFLSKNVNKILEAGKKLLMGIVNAIPTILSSLASSLPQILNTIIRTLTEMLPTLISTVVEMLPELIQSIVDFFVTSVPDLLDAAIQMFMALDDAIPEVIVSLTDALPDIIEAIVGTLTDNIDSILNAAVNMLMAIVDAIPKIITCLASNLPKIITSIIEALVSATPDILVAAVEALGGILGAIGDIVLQIPGKMGEIIAAVLEAVGGWFWDLFEDAKKAFDAFGDAIVAAGVAVLQWVKDLPGKIWEKIQEIWEDLKYLGSKIIEGIKDGLLKSDALDNAIKTQVQKAYNAAKESAEVHSPSRLFARIGRFMAEGLGVGWTDEMGELNKQIEKDLDFGEGTVGLNVKKTFETAETVTASAQMKLSDSDIDKIVRGLSLTIYNTTEIDGEKIKEDVYTYTVDRMGDETRAIQIAQGGY